MGKRVLVTGSNGSYGSALVLELLKQGYEVYATDIVVPERPIKNFIQADITKPEEVAKFPEVEAVIHPAGVIDVLATDMHKAVHLDGTKNIINHYKDNYNDTLKVFVTVSSAAIHGGTPEDTLIDEDRPRTLKDSYTTSKAEEADLTRELIGDRCIIIEPALVYDEKNRYMFKEIVEMIALKLLVFLPEHGSYKLNMVYPYDLATGTLCAMERGDFGEAYIICDDYPLKLKDIADMVAAETSVRPLTLGIKKETLQRLMGQMDNLQAMLPALQGMEPLSTMLENMGLDLGAGLELPIDPDYMTTHHHFTNAKLKEASKNNSGRWRVDPTSVDYFKDGWKPVINPFEKMPEVIRYWTSTRPPIIPKDSDLQDVVEFLFRYVQDFLEK
ncbi:MAG: NAD-dependent epimerase/dehydratase family protein [Candidatus Lokiarchaeota archaeon]|nr:NAD-dependent epimerase/dehydratase family protein [Candidatus Lokiarchaeota archaeon]